MPGTVTVEAKDMPNKIGTLIHCSGDQYVISNCIRTVPKPFSGTTRGVVAGFSSGSAIRMRAYLRSCVARYANMVTLTYPSSFPCDGRESKEHLRRFIQELRRYSTARNVPENEWGVFWFLEFQQRGAPHYHLFVTHEYPKEWIAQTWYRIVGTDDKRHLHAGTRIEKLRAGRGGTIVYASKYAAKAEQKTVPDGFDNVGRFWGVWGQKSTLAASTFVSKAQEDENGLVRAKKEEFFAEIGRLLALEEAEAWKPKDGVRILRLKTAHAQAILRHKLNMLIHEQAKTGSALFTQWMFYGAEIQQ